MGNSKQRVKGDQVEDARYLQPNSCHCFSPLKLAQVRIRVSGIHRAIPLFGYKNHVGIDRARGFIRV
jgi:hypothetical protein